MTNYDVKFIFKVQLMSGCTFHYYENMYFGDVLRWTEMSYLRALLLFYKMITQIPTFASIVPYIHTNLNHLLYIFSWVPTWGECVYKIYENNNVILLYILYSPLKSFFFLNRTNPGWGLYIQNKSSCVRTKIQTILIAKICLKQNGFVIANL